MEEGACSESEGPILSRTIPSCQWVPWESNGSARSVLPPGKSPVALLGHPCVVVVALVSALNCEILTIVLATKKLTYLFLEIDMHTYVPIHSTIQKELLCQNRKIASELNSAMVIELCMSY